MRVVSCLLAIVVLLAGCAVPIPTATATIPTSTPRPFPTFPPVRTKTPKPDIAPTHTDTPTPTVPPFDTPTPTRSIAGAKLNPVGSKPSAAPPSKIARADVPGILRPALIAAGAKDPKVYWFTFDAGDREQALMIQYASPLRWHDDFLPMMRAAKLTAVKYYLGIDPPLYTLIIAATDITGQSDLVVRLRRSAAEKWSAGEIGDDDLVNNYYEPVQIVVSCTTADCTAKMATPFPTFPSFPFPFPTPTP